MNIKKTLALLLVIAMCFSFVPSFAFANDDGQIVYHVSTEQMDTEYSGLFIADSLSLSVGGSATLVPRYYYNEGVDNVYVEGDGITSDFVTDLTWKSNNPEIATVNNGVVTGVSAGTTTIEITATDQYYFPGSETGDTCTVTVTASSLTVTFNPNGGTLADSTSNTVEVTSGSTVSAPQVERPGYNLIGWFPAFTIEGVEQQATDAWNFDSAVTSDMTLTARWSPIDATGVSLDQNRLNLNVGETATLTATVTPAGAQIDSWTSSNPSVATVENGVVTARASGSAVITVAAGSHSATCNVAVTQAENYVAYVNQTGYETLAGAISAATSGETIYLAADVADIGSISLPAGVTLDGTYNGVTHTISGNSSIRINAAGGTVQNVNFSHITDNKPKTSYNYTTGTLTAIYGSGSATITGCNFDSVSWDAIQLTPAAGSVISITGNTFRTDTGYGTLRYVHVQSAKSVDFTVTVTGNRFYDCDELNQTGLEVYYPVDPEKVTLSGNYMDSPMAVCIGTGGNSYNNATEEAFPFKNEALTDDVTVVATVLDPNRGVILFTDLEAAIDYAQTNNLTDVTLVNDATVKEAITVESGKTIVFDLNGHSVTAAVQTGSGTETRHYYAFENYGTFTLVDGAGNGYISARGIENLENGVLTITSGKIIALDANGGAAIWNEATLYINGGEFEATYAGPAVGGVGPGCLNNRGTAIITKGIFNDASVRCYAICNFGDLTVNEANPGDVVVSGVHGGITCDTGSLTINGGTYTAQNYYGLWITNDGNRTTVTVNSGTFVGGSTGKNALRASVDDGKQDVSDATITINGGQFQGYGNSAAAVAMNASNSAHSWGMNITGGVFSTEPDSSYLAQGLEVVSNTDPDTSAVYPYTVGEHVHNYVYGNPTWLWRAINGTWSVSSTYAGECSCGETTTETLSATVVKTEEYATITYTATDSRGNTDTRTFMKTFTVTYEGSELPETFTYGQACRIAPSDGHTYDWYVQEGDGERVLRATGAATFYFPVTANVTVTKELNVSATTQTASSAIVEASSPAVGQYRYKFVWSIPEGSQVQSAMIYRCMDTHEPLIEAAETLLAQTNLRSINTNMFVRNGEFTLTGKNLSSGTTQTIMFRLVYTLNGETHTLDTEIRHIAIS